MADFSASVVTTLVPKPSKNCFCPSVSSSSNALPNAAAGSAKRNTSPEVSSEPACPAQERPNPNDTAKTWRLKPTCNMTLQPFVLNDRTEQRSCSGERNEGEIYHPGMERVMVNCCGIRVLHPETGFGDAISTPVLGSIESLISGFDHLPPVTFQS